MMSNVGSVLAVLPWFAWIPIVGIIGGTATSIAKMIFTHRERMAMIHQGIHPDAVNAKPVEYSEV